MREKAANHCCPLPALLRCCPERKATGRAVEVNCERAQETQRQAKNLRVEDRRNGTERLRDETIPAREKKNTLVLFVKGLLTALLEYKTIFSFQVV